MTARYSKKQILLLLRLLSKNKNCSFFLAKERKKKMKFSIAQKVEDEKKILLTVCAGTNENEIEIERKNRTPNTEHQIIKTWIDIALTKWNNKKKLLVFNFWCLNVDLPEMLFIYITVCSLNICTTDSVRTNWSHQCRFIGKEKKTFVGWFLVDEKLNERHFRGVCEQRMLDKFYSLLVTYVSQHTYTHIYSHTSINRFGHVRRTHNRYIQTLLLRCVRRYHVSHCVCNNNRI